MKRFIFFLLLFSFSNAYAGWDAQPVFVVPTSFVVTSDTVSITTANTEQRLPDIGPISSVVIKPKHTNVERLLISGTSDTSILSFSLATTDSITLDIDDLSKIFIRSKSAGERAEYFALR